MEADFDLMGDGTVVGGHGGPRPGSGRKKGYSPKRIKELEAQTESAETKLDDEVEAVTSTALKKAQAVARKESALADLNELDYKVKSGQYLERAAFREAAATVLSELAQALRSLPDALERKHALPPKVIQDVERTVDEALASAAAGLEMFTESDQ
jgi:phage terminase Nu1 subunit (DNA packaging protein)